MFLPSFPNVCLDKDYSFHFVKFCSLKSGKISNVCRDYAFFSLPCFCFRYGHGYEIFSVACNNAKTLLASACKVGDFPFDST